MEVGAVLRRASVFSQVEVGVSARIPATVNRPLTVVFGLADEQGGLKSGRRSVPTQAVNGYQLTFPLAVDPGRYSLRFAVADSAGNVGSVEIPVVATLQRIGALEASDLLVWVTDAASRTQLTAVGDLPTDAVTVTGMIELYSASSVPQGLTVALALVDATGLVVSEKNAGLTPGDRMLRADAGFDARTLRAGTYQLRATVSSPGAPPTVISTTFTKR